MKIVRAPRGVNCFIEFEDVATAAAVREQLQVIVKGISTSTVDAQVVKSALCATVLSTVAGFWCFHINIHSQ